MVPYKTLLSVGDVVSNTNMYFTELTRKFKRTTYESYEGVTNYGVPYQLDHGLINYLVRNDIIIEDIDAMEDFIQFFKHKNTEYLKGGRSQEMFIYTNHFTSQTGGWDYDVIEILRYMLLPSDTLQLEILYFLTTKDTPSEDKDGYYIQKRLEISHRIQDVNEIRFNRPKYNYYAAKCLVLNNDMNIYMTVPITCLIL